MSPAPWPAMSDRDAAMLVARPEKDGDPFRPRARLM
jgi:hypothetical protein